MSNAITAHDRIAENLLNYGKSLIKVENIVTLQRLDMLRLDIIARRN